MRGEARAFLEKRDGEACMAGKSKCGHHEWDSSGRSPCLAQAIAAEKPAEGGNSRVSSLMELHRHISSVDQLTKAASDDNDGQRRVLDETRPERRVLFLRA